MLAQWRTPKRGLFTGLGSGCVNYRALKLCAGGPSDRGKSVPRQTLTAVVLVMVIAIGQLSGWIRLRSR
jgi:hypothetical protein